MKHLAPEQLEKDRIRKAKNAELSRKRRAIGLDISPKKYAPEGVESSIFRLALFGKLA